VVRGVRRRISAPPDIDALEVTAGSPEVEDEQESPFRIAAAGQLRRHWLEGARYAAEMPLLRGLMAIIGNWMEPNRLSIRLFGNVRTTTPK
jgi:hypothetical protein